VGVRERGENRLQSLKYKSFREASNLTSNNLVIQVFDQALNILKLPRTSKTKCELD